MNVIDAAHYTVHDQPGGSESLGPRMGMSPAVLRSKVNPATATHHLTLAEADRMMGLTGDHRILIALAAAHGYALHRVEGDAEASLLSAQLAASAAKGDLSAILAAAMSDGRVTQNEAKAIANAGAHAQAAIVQLVAVACAQTQRCAA